MSASLRNVVVSGTFSVASTASQAVVVYGNFNVTISGSFTGSVAVQRSFDGGSTWNTVATDGTGTAAVYTAPCSVSGYEGEWGVQYQIYCSALSAGTITYRFSANPVLTNSPIPN